MSIHDPQASLRAAVDELLMLERHCAHEFCADCARKHARGAAALVRSAAQPDGTRTHARTAAALAGEAISLGGFREPWRGWATVAARLAVMAEDPAVSRAELGRAARALRRALMRLEGPRTG